MKNGATIMLETSWSLNTDEPIQEGSCVLCGSKAGISLKNNELRINKVELGRQVVTHVDCSAGGVAFYDGANVSPADAEAMAWIDAIVNDTEQIVKPEQACVVSEILEAIYVSSKTGKPVYFE
jgi:predicted dehydrogenase